MYKISRIDATTFKVIGDGADLKVDMTSWWSPKLSGKGSRSIDKATIFDAVRKWTQNEYYMIEIEKKRQAEEFAKIVPKINHTKLYNVHLNYDICGDGRKTYRKNSDKLMTGYVLDEMIGRDVIGFEQIDIHVNDLYIIGSLHGDSLAGWVKEDNRLFHSMNTVYCTGKTVSEFLQEGKYLWNLRPCHLTKETVIDQIRRFGGNISSAQHGDGKIYSVFGSTSSEKAISHINMLERAEKEFERSERHVGA